ncbi:hypothetical protein [Haloactinomyces albus]|uniref:Transcriptional regulator with XRE-family HTH domain n=1 Tax=Haloactinomyces albus TaxID=1352928 RepID=A0AAE4CL30_9ACTN|nr:hypothetical protein [Haloactinomyces albus]MDR7301825.1 transcriptional regulator with XRE-family HTH domain [Haloactinomyces albus]MDR7304730.1 transcriptional regulator with XRE-family HTH domain [Haloactinomyces albus]
MPLLESRGKLLLVLVAKFAAQEGRVGKNWDAVAETINTRMEYLELTQQQVANRAGLALQTVRELQHNLVPRKRTSRTLGVMSEALGLPRNHLSTVLDGQNSAESESHESAALADIYGKLADITKRLDSLERRLPDE